MGCGCCGCGFAAGCCDFDPGCGGFGPGWAFGGGQVTGCAKIPVMSAPVTFTVVTLPLATWLTNSLYGSGTCALSCGMSAHAFQMMRSPSISQDRGPIRKGGGPPCPPGGGPGPRAGREGGP